MRRKPTLNAVFSMKPPPTDQIDADVLEELRRWGMVMPKSLEVTGMGRRYAGITRRGVLE